MNKALINYGSGLLIKRRFETTKQGMDLLDVVVDIH